jgi:4-hydroxybenzoate polyprenyltransferase
MRPADLMELVRAPAALSVPGDAVAGAAAAGCLDRRTARVAAASVCLYWAGMAANDWADRGLDAVERPQRPIPSGRVSPGVALAIAAGLTAAGIALAGVGGTRRTTVTAGLLAGAVWGYDLRLKNTAFGPAGMALCRGLDVLMGASPGRMRRAIGPAAVVAAHTYVVTELSRREVTGATRALPAAGMAATAAIAAAGAAGPRPGARARPCLPERTGLRAVSALLAACYATAFGRALRRALAEPKAGNVRAAVGAGIMSLPALQGALAARYGRPLAGAAVAAAAPVGRWLARVVSPT